MNNHTNHEDCRVEHDLLGSKELPHSAYYGIQTLRALENFPISGVPLSHFPIFIRAFAMVKKAAAIVNHDLGLLTKPIATAIDTACDQILTDKFHEHFLVDMVQGGVGTSTNMNINEVIANCALEILGHQKGEYQYCHPNNHVNCSQSTNDAYPTALKIALINYNGQLLDVLRILIQSLRQKAAEFHDVVKMGRTQLGYEKCSELADRALVENKGVYEIVLEENFISQERLNDILNVEKMTLS